MIVVMKELPLQTLLEYCSCQSVSEKQKKKKYAFKCDEFVTKDWVKSGL